MNFDQIERMMEHPMIQSQMQDVLNDPNMLNMLMMLNIILLRI